MELGHWLSAISILIPLLGGGVTLKVMVTANKIRDELSDKLAQVERKIHGLELATIGKMGDESKAVAVLSQQMTSMNAGMESVKREMGGVFNRVADLDHRVNEVMVKLASISALTGLGSKSTEQ